MPRAAALFSALAAALLLLSACRAPTKKTPEELQRIARSSDEALAESYERFLSKRGLLYEASRVESLLVATRHPGGAPTYREEIEARLSALELTIDGLTVADVERLRDAGIPVFELDWRTQRIGQAATADAVVVGEVLQKFDARSPADGFRSSVRVIVQEVLKGRVPADTILVRRLSGLDRYGRPVQVRNEFDPALGKEYMLFLSNPFYDYHLQYPDDRADEVAVGAAAEALQPRPRGETTALDRATAIAEMDPAALDSLDNRYAAYYLERYPGLRLEWLSRQAREEVYTEVRRVMHALQPVRPTASPEPAADVDG